MYERHKRRYSLCAKGERAVNVVLIKVRVGLHGPLILVFGGFVFLHFSFSGKTCLPQFMHEASKELSKER